MDQSFDNRMTEAHYLYGVAPCSEKMSLGEIGIENCQVVTIPYQDLAAVAHGCTPRPYASKDEDVVTPWVLAHQRVVETAWERYGTIIPFRFDVIVKGPEPEVVNWLKQEYGNLKEKMARLEGKAEYGVQIGWDPKIIMEKMAQTDPQAQQMRRKIQSLSEGTAYLFEQKLEKLLKQKVEQEADRYFKDFYGRIRTCVDDVQVEKVNNKEKNRQMLANLSCLAGAAKVQDLGKELEQIQSMNGFFVRFTGPWPPYSFVSP